MAPAHRTTLRVRYGETDQMGVVYHANYVVYFEIGRTEFMRDHGLRYADMEQAGMRLVLTDVGLKYRQAARYDDVLQVETTLVEAGAVRVRFTYRILRARADAVEELLCEGFTVLACVGTDGRPLRMRSPFRDTIAALVAQR